MRQRGFTLLEVVTAIALLGVIAIAVAGWTRLALRGASWSSSEAQSLAAEARTVALIRADLRYAQRDADGLRWVLNEGALRCITASGIDAAGLHSVSWHNDDDGRLVRTLGDAEPRPVLSPRPMSFTSDDEGRLWLQLGDRPPRLLASDGPVAEDDDV